MPFAGFLPAGRRRHANRAHGLCEDHTQSGVAGRIATGADIDPAQLELLSVVAESDTLLVRYGVRR